MDEFAVDQTPGPDRDGEAIRRGCTRFVSYDPPRSARDRLQELAEYADADSEPDKSGSGALIEDLERRVAGLLGKPAAVFMPSGKTAQLIALRLWCARVGTDSIAIHARSHIEADEARAYQFVHGLKSMELGDANRQVVAADLEALVGPVGAAVLELPLRRLGWLAPSWDELEAISRAARARGTPLHADAARIWEIQPYYGRPHAEIAALFDSLYVSFYKGLGAPAGAALAGPEDLISEARLWQRRMGANLNTLYPYVVAARKGLDERLPRMPDYVAKARAIAGALHSIPGLRVTPDPPHCNAMQVVLDGDQAHLEDARLDVAERTGIWPFGAALTSPIQGLAIFEITVWDGAFDLTEDEIAGAIHLLAERLRIRSGLPGAGA